MSSYPLEISDAVHDTHLDIEVSEIRSKKLFNLLVKFSQKAENNFFKKNTWQEDLPDCKPYVIHSDKTSAKSSEINNSFKLRNKVNNDARKVRQFRISEKSKINAWKQISVLPWNKLNENFSSKYDEILDKIKSKVAINKRNRLQLFTFDPRKVRVRSPVLSRARKLIDENGFYQICKFKRNFEL